MRDQPHESGRFGEVYPESDFRDAVRDHQPAGTSEVANTVGCTRQNASYRLGQLEDDGKVESKMVGNSLVWMLTEDA